MLAVVDRSSSGTAQKSALQIAENLIAFYLQADLRAKSGLRYWALRAAAEEMGGHVC
jgi:hypothetical protein